MGEMLLVEIKRNVTPKLSEYLVINVNEMETMYMCNASKTQ